METVAPHAGAWIETCHLRGSRALGQASHPTRVRGLKPGLDGLVIIARVSHPTRVRGLKLSAERAENVIVRVAPHAGAWIETKASGASGVGHRGRTPRGCVD